MPQQIKDFEAFKSEYHEEEKEILILTSDDGGGAVKFNDSWSPSKYFLAYVDIAKNEMKNGEGRVCWLISEEENKKHGFEWPYNFKNGVIYRLSVRELIDKTVPKNMLPSYFNRFMVVSVLEENVHNDELLEVLAEYRKPVKIADDALGEFELNKDLSLFSGEIGWLGEKISVSLSIDIDNKGTWTRAINVLRKLFEQQKQMDAEFRAFTAEKLTALANDWREDGDTAEISKKDFIGRISLSELNVTSGGSYEAYYDDGDMFAGHAITVYGSIKKGMKDATIVG